MLFNRPGVAADVLQSPLSIKSHVKKKKKRRKKLFFKKLDNRVELVGGGSVINGACHV